MRGVVLLTSDSIGSKEKECAVRSGYIKSMLKVGLLPYIAPLDFDVCSASELAKEACEHVSGVLITGGVDIDPSLYHESPHEKLGEIDELRDRFEMALVKEAISRKLPLMGICRGSQIINVALGGSLYQDIHSQVPDALNHTVNENRSEPAHRIDIVDKKSHLFEIIKQECAEVNSTHHQAIKSLGDNLRAVSYAPDGIIEAIEHSCYPFLLGVQWHPEDMIEKNLSMHAIFERFACAVEESMR